MLTTLSCVWYVYIDESLITYQSKKIKMYYIVPFFRYLTLKIIFLRTNLLIVKLYNFFFIDYLEM